MEIKKGTDVAVVVTREWIDHRCVKFFVREGREISKDGDSHIILARVLDANDPRGLWIDNKGKAEGDTSVKLQSFMIPWHAVLSIVLAHTLSPEVWEKSQKLGFVSGVIE